MAEYFVEGWTEEITYELKSDGAAYPLSGCTITLRAYGANGSLVSFSGSITISDESGGVVKFNPAANDLLAINSPYKVRFRVVDAAGQVLFFPKQEPEVWVVRSR